MMQLLFHNLLKSLHLNNTWPRCISIRFKTYNFKRVLASSTLHFIKVYKLPDNYSVLGYDAVLTGNLLPKFRRRLLPPALKYMKKNKPLSEMVVRQSLLTRQRPLLPQNFIIQCTWQKLETQQQATCSPKPF